MYDVLSIHVNRGFLASAFVDYDSSPAVHATPSWLAGLICYITSGVRICSRRTASQETMVSALTKAETIRFHSRVRCREPEPTFTKCNRSLKTVIIISYLMERGGRSLPIKIPGREYFFTLQSYSLSVVPIITGTLRGISVVTFEV